MTATSVSTVSDQLRRIVLQPTGGIVGLVAEFLDVCWEQGVEVDWRAERCRIRPRGSEWEDLTDLPLRNSVFRAILAHMAALCNRHGADSVSPYGGKGLLPVGKRAGAMMEFEFVNTPAEQRVMLAPRRGEDWKNSLSLRDLENSSTGTDRRYAVGSVIHGKVVKIVKFGAFVQLKHGVEGLVHISELSHKWVDRVSDIVKVGDEIDAVVLSVDPHDDQRLMLSMKRITPPLGGEKASASVVATAEEDAPATSRPNSSHTP